MKKQSAKLEFLFYVATIRVGFDFIYEKVINPVYSYVGFDNSASLGWFLSSWLILIVFSLLWFKIFQNESQKTSNEILFLLFLINIIPFSTMIRYGALGFEYVFWNTTYFLVLFLANLILQKFFKSNRTINFWKNRHFKDSQLILISVICFAIVLYISGRYTNFRFNFDLANVYDLRLESREFNLPTSLTYVFGWTKALLPVLIFVFFKRKNYIIGLICVVVHLLNFGIDGIKSTLFMTILVLFFLVCPDFSFVSFNGWLCKGLLCLISFAILEVLFFNTFVISSLFIRRIFFLNNLLGEVYFDFFSTNSPDFFRQSFLRHFGFVSPYTESIARIIGEVHFGSPEMNCNNGFISDAMANLGLAGIFIMPCLIALVLRLIDNSSKGINQKLMFICALYIALALSNSFLATSLLSHGIIILILFLNLVNRDVPKLNTKVHLAQKR